jgi:hypothetical protein
MHAPALSQAAVRPRQGSSQPNTTKRRNDKPQLSIIKQQRATNAEMMIKFKTANMLGLPVPRPLLGKIGSERQAVGDLGDDGILRLSYIMIAAWV